MMFCMAHLNRPSKAALGKIAEKQPLLLNILVAYFVMEWQSVRLTSIPHGEDQCGKTRRVPNYVSLLGIDACIHYLLQSPTHRGAGGTGYLSLWLEKI